MREDEGIDERVEVPPSPSRPLRLHPFAGVRLSPARVADPASSRVFARPYRDAPDRLARWQSNGELTHDAAPALYLHEFTADGVTVRGLVGALDLTTRAASFADRAVLPHEAIHPGRADDLATRMQHTALNPAPILLVHHGPAQLRESIARVAAQPPDHQLTDRAGQHHRVWAIQEPAELSRIEAALASSTLLIADGHHRYAAYLRLQQSHPGTGWDHGLAMVVDQDDTPFFLGAIHRSLPGVSVERVAALASAAGAAVRFTTRGTALASLRPGRWLTTDGERWVVVDTTSAPGHLSAVEDLHALVIDRLEPRPSVGYHHSVADALSGLERREGPGVAMLLPAPDFELLDRTLHQKRLLPEKATSFQPKPSPGVLMRSIQPR